MAWEPLRAAPATTPSSSSAASPRHLVAPPWSVDPRGGGCASQGPQCVAPCERLCGGPSPPTTHPTVTTPDLLSTYYVLGAKNGAIMKTLSVLAQRRHILVPPPYFPTDPQTLPLCFFRSLLQCHCLCAAHPSPNSLPSPPFLCLCLSPPPGCTLWEGQSAIVCSILCSSPHLGQCQAPRKYVLTTGVRSSSAVST